jgi:hypothetical protein
VPKTYVNFPGQRRPHRGPRGVQAGSRVVVQSQRMPIRILALDLDGTLLNSHSEISTSNLQALVAAHERGVQIVVTTGRRF